VKAASTGSAVTGPPFPAPRIRHLETGWTNALLRAADRVLHRVLFDFLAGIGVWVAVLALRKPRRSSRRYLAAILGRPPSLLEVWRHFMAFTAVHLLRLRVASGRRHDCRPGSGCEAFAGLMASGRPALLGTFHIGSSDLLGFYLGRFRRHVHMVRFRLGRSQLPASARRTVQRVGHLHLGERKGEPALCAQAGRRVGRFDRDEV
jgi:lauroyl/myristoyl acyltransferase